jgi:hypothetical protein
MKHSIEKLKDYVMKLYLILPPGVDSASNRNEYQESC